MHRSILFVVSILFSALLLQAAPAPQTNLPKVTLTLGSESLTAQIAADDASRERGLMSRNNLSENEAMLFVFPSPAPFPSG